MESFSGFKRIAVVVCPKPEELDKRTKEKKEKKGFEVPEFALNDMKGKRMDASGLSKQGMEPNVGRALHCWSNI
jgi:hypothetical protein